MTVRHASEAASPAVTIGSLALRAVAVLIGAVAFLLVTALAATVDAGAATRHAVSVAAEVPAGGTQAKRLAMMRSPAMLRNCLSDAAGTACSYPLRAAPAEPSSIAAGITPVWRDDRTAVLGLLIVALAMAATAVVVFWRHLTAALVPDEARGKRSRSRGR